MARLPWLSLANCKLCQLPHFYSETDGEYLDDFLKGMS